MADPTMAEFLQGRIDPLAPYRKPPEMTGHPVGDFFRRLNSGQLPVQQSMRAWFNDNPMAKEFGARALMAPAFLGVRTPVPMAPRATTMLERVQQNRAERTGVPRNARRPEASNELNPPLPTRDRDLYAFDPARGPGNNWSNTHIDDVAAMGGDRARALSYWQGLRDLNTLEPPPLRPSLPPEPMLPARRPGPTQGQRDLYDLPAATDPREAAAIVSDPRHRNLNDPARTQRYWDAASEFELLDVPPPGTRLHSLLPLAGAAGWLMPSPEDR
jgi:hypothetical protein